MTREEALRIVALGIPRDWPVVACNGHISRALHALDDRPAAFYMIGSMGLAPSIALGICLAQPKRRVAVLDGDGNVLMNLGALAQAGATQPSGLLHVCFDNESHASTGGQRTIASRVDLSAIARAAGYRWVGRAETDTDLAGVMTEAVTELGPAFLHVKVAPGPLPAGTPRVELAPEQISARLRRALAR